MRPAGVSHPPPATRPPTGRRWRRGRLWGWALLPPPAALQWRSATRATGPWGPIPSARAPRHGLLRSFSTCWRARLLAVPIAFAPEAVFIAGTKCRGRRWGLLPYPFRGVDSATDGAPTRDGPPPLGSPLGRLVTRRPFLDTDGGCTGGDRVSGERRGWPLQSAAAACMVSLRAGWGEASVDCRSGQVWRVQLWPRRIMAVAPYPTAANGRHSLCAAASIQLCTGTVYG